MATFNDLKFYDHSAAMPLVMCAICQGSVEWIHTWQRPDIMGWEVVVECHGETDRCTVYDHTLMLMSQDEAYNFLKSGIAFQQPKGLIDG